LQRKLRGWSDAATKDELRSKFLDGMCSPRHDTVLYVGNLAKRQQVFVALGVFYPKL
jgi:hypothetical protein